MSGLFFFFWQRCKDLFDVNIFLYVRKISYVKSKLQTFHVYMCVCAHVPMLFFRLKFFFLFYI